MKKRYVLMGVAAVFVAAAVIGGTLAALNTNTEGNAGTGVTEISTADMGISLSSDGTTVETLETMALTPGGDTPCSYYLENSSDQDGYSIYAKVILYKSWAEDTLDAQKVGISFLNSDGSYMSYPGTDSGNGTAQSYEEIENSAGAKLAGSQKDWIIGYADEEQLVLYYTKPLAPGEKSGNFMDAVSFAADMGNEYADAQLSLTVEVHAVQVNAEEAAMQAEWGVFPLFDENGTILNIFETAAERDSYQ